MSIADRLVANTRFEFSSVAFPNDKFHVVEMEGFEAISRPFRFTLTLVSDDASIDFDTMLRNPATFVIHGADSATSAPYHGVLAEFEQLHRVDGYVFYRVVLVPRLWRLSLYRVSEVYQDEQSIVTTIENVFKAGQLGYADYEFRLTGTYRPRTFVCQFEETHLDFVSRWMENEGIYYHFDHSGGSDKLIVTDGRTMHDTRAIHVDYRPLEELDTGASSTSLRDFVGRQKPLPHDLILQSYNYRKARVHLKAHATVSEHGLGQVVIYGENFRDEEEGRRYAKLRAEEILCRGKLFVGEGAAVGLRSGYFADVSHHFRADFNGRYLVTEIHHRGSQAGALLTGVRTPHRDTGRSGETSYHNSFCAIGASVQFRPERATPKPRVSGTLNASIDGEGLGEYAELDEFGQYKVRFPFGITDKHANKGSARVRMATLYSGADHGMHFPLHKDAEVLLSFTDGDPDQPVIVGTVPNSENHSVVTRNNPHENKISTAGGNQVCMGDSKGKEVLWLHSPFHNSTIGLGSTDPKGGGSVWASTAGSSESVTVGETNLIFAGEKNSVTMSYESALSASITNKFALGANVAFSWGQDVNWRVGRSVSIDDTENTALSGISRTLAMNQILLFAGQKQESKIIVESLKSNVKRSIGLSVAANAVIAAAAGAAIDREAVDQKTEKAAPWSPGSYGVVAAQAALGNLATMLPVHKLLSLSADAIIRYVRNRDTYSSTVLIDDKGIDLKFDQLLTKSQIKVNGDGIDIASAPGTAESKIRVNGNVVLSAGNSYLKVLQSGGVSMIWSESDAVVTNPSVSVKPDEVKATGPGSLSSLSLVKNAATLEFGGSSSATVSATNLALKSGTSSIVLDVTGMKVDGTLLRLG